MDTIDSTETKKKPSRPLSASSKPGKKRPARKPPVTITSSCTRIVTMDFRRFDKEGKPVMDDDGRQSIFKLVIGSKIDDRNNNPGVPSPIVVLQRGRWNMLKRDRRQFKALMARQAAHEIHIIGA